MRSKGAKQTEKYIDFNIAELQEGAIQEKIEKVGYKPLLGDQRGKTRWVVFVKDGGD